MSSGWMALAAALLCGAPATADDVMSVNMRDFTIPIRVLPDRRHEVKELMLYKSIDQGRTWEIQARATPDKTGFEIRNFADGLYYFSIAVIDRAGKPDPADVYKAPVGQKILIDTQKPALGLTVERTGDDVGVSYTIQEERPDRESVKLEYKVGEGSGGVWTPLPIQFASRGFHRFRPATAGPVTVRLSMRDLATNEATEEKTVAPAIKLDPRMQLTNGTDLPAPFPGPPTPPPSPPSPGPTPLPLTKSLATSQQPPPPAAREDAPYGFNTPRGSLPPLQIVNKREVKLGFDVTRFGPSGLGAVDVYVTTDEGAHWDKTQGAPNVTMPVTPETRSGSPVQGSVTVSLPKDGVVYGFHLDVKSRSGISKGPPKSGDVPQVRIELDTINPEAELYEPRPDPARHDCLVLMWKAGDRNLAANPVSIEWAAQPQGPWLFIGEQQLPNTGNYLWQIGENTPPRVYLKLTVRDTAGNSATAVTPTPVMIDLTPPEVNRVIVMPNGR